VDTPQPTITPRPNPKCRQRPPPAPRTGRCALRGVHGGAEAILARALADYDAGEYRWVAQVFGHLVFADPENIDAHQLQAAAFEQLGYQAESGSWRNFYLTGALELRGGMRSSPGTRPATRPTSWRR